MNTPSGHLRQSPRRDRTGDTRAPCHSRRDGVRHTHRLNGVNPGSFSIRARRRPAPCAVRARAPGGDGFAVPRRVPVCASLVRRPPTQPGRSARAGGGSPRCLRLSNARGREPRKFEFTARAGRGVNSLLVRLASIIQRALDFDPDAQLSYRLFQESQTLAVGGSGSRICRHGGSVFSASSPRRSI